MKIRHIQKKIPSGWNWIATSDIFDFVRTYAFSRENLLNNTRNEEGIGNIHYGDIHSTYLSASIDLTEVSVPMIKDEKFSPSKESFLRDGDLVMADASEDYEGVGVTVSLHGLEKKKIIGGLHTFVLRDNKNKTDQYFRQYIFRNQEIRRRLQKIANGVSVYGISKTALAKISIPLPAIPEQKRIVVVLETWDRAIEKLAQKIEIKNKIKKGLMQELLTGKKRLPGFGDKWNFFKLGDVCKFQSGYPFSSVDFSKNKGIRIIRNRDLKGNSQTIFYSGVSIPEGYLVKNRDILIGMDGDFMTHRWQKGEALLNQRVGRLINFRESNKDFLYYRIQIPLKIIEKETSSTTVKHLSSTIFEKFRVKLPSNKEQSAIAEILTIADQEIESLQKKLSFLKDQKKYLLNNLITGTIRTPESMKITK